MFRKLTLLAVVWTFGLIVLGAYVRLSDAGLGCPDWPLCYGKLSPVHALDEITQAQQVAPQGPVSVDKAWKEMVHRYFASTLGLLIVVIACMAWRQRRQLRQSPRLALVSVGVVCLQGAFGAWTVTMLLKPAIVTGHLIGGMLTLVLMVWLALRQRDWPRVHAAGLRKAARLGLGIVACQIILGGWVSTNYAALVCADFPSCQGQWLPPMEFADAFHLFRELGQTASGNMLNMANLTAIHWLHRLGALITLLYIGTLAWRLYAAKILPSLACLLGLALLAQIGLGIANILLRLPLAVAVLHNAGAALLLVLMVVLNFRLARSR